MMRLEPVNGDYFKVVNPSQVLQKYIKEHVSAKHKHFSTSWFLKSFVVVDFLKYAVSVGAPIDFQCIPEDVMRIIEGYSPSSQDPWSTLYLLKNSPDFIVDAVWKALAKRYHPDSSTGNEEMFIKYKKAYDKVKSNS